MHNENGSNLFKFRSITVSPQDKDASRTRFRLLSVKRLHYFSLKNIYFPINYMLNIFLDTIIGYTYFGYTYLLTKHALTFIHWATARTVNLHVKDF